MSDQSELSDLQTWARYLNYHLSGLPYGTAHGSVCVSRSGMSAKQCGTLWRDGYPRYGIASPVITWGYTPPRLKCDQASWIAQAARGVTVGIGNGGMFAGYARHGELKYIGTFAEHGTRILTELARKPGATLFWLDGKEKLPSQTSGEVRVDIGALMTGGGARMMLDNIVWTDKDTGKTFYYQIYHSATFISYCRKKGLLITFEAGFDSPIPYLGWDWVPGDANFDTGPKPTGSLSGMRVRTVRSLLMDSRTFDLFFGYVPARKLPDWVREFEASFMVNRQEATGGRRENAYEPTLVVSPSRDKIPPDW